MTSEIADLRAEVEHLKLENSKMSDETDELRIEAELYKRENAKMSSDIDDLQTEIEVLRLEKSQISGDYSSLGAKFDKLHNHYRTVCQERDHAHGQVAELRGQIKSKDGQIHELQKEILLYKKSLASSTRVDGQLSDMRIQDAMSGLFFAVRDWALKMVRQDKTGRFDSNFLKDIFCRSANVEQSLI